MKASYVAAAAAAGLVLALTPLADAADIEGGVLPAVSGVNGKVEFSAGLAELDDFDNDGVFQGGASLSFPLGATFGMQADIAAADQFDDTMFGGTLHLFTRDPGSYLFGIAGGAATSDDADLYYVGPEAEFYLGSLSIELWGGYLNADVDGSSSDDEMFGFADLALYATDDFRIALGAHSIAGFESAHIGLEWQMGEVGLPLSLTADLRAGEDDLFSATAGFKFYFGGEDKSLIRRHREDDPRNRSLDLFSAAGTAFKTPGQGGPIIGVCPPGEVDVDPGPATDCQFP
jgi:hypothetical protein